MSATDLSTQVLLVLSSQQAMSVHDIATVLEMPMEVVWKEMTVLEQNKLVATASGRMQITHDGLAQLQRTGLHLPNRPPTASSARLATAKAPVVVESIRGADSIILIPPILILSLVVLICLVGLSSNQQEMLAPALFLSAILIFLMVIYFWRSFRTVPEYMRLVVFRLGRCIGERGPGFVMVMPVIEKVNEVDMRVNHKEVPHEPCITQDNVVIDVDFVLYWQVQQAVWSITRVTNPEESLRLLATALLRAVIAHFPFSQVQTQRESINDMLRQKIDEISTNWGVFVTTVEIREIKPPQEIINSMQLQAAAEWKRQATVTEAEGYREAQLKRAEGDAEALRKLYEVAALIDDKTLRLKYISMLSDLGNSTSTKIVLPVELMDLVRPLLGNLGLRDGSQLNPRGENALPVLSSPNDAPSN